MGRVGVLLLNLGGPERLEDVGPFLFNLFSDPEIIRIPFPWLQRSLAWFISARRTKTSQENYRKIGGGSPLRRITEAQAQALQEQLQCMHSTESQQGLLRQKGVSCEIPACGTAEYCMSKHQILLKHNI